MIEIKKIKNFIAIFLILYVSNTFAINTKSNNNNEIKKIETTFLKLMSLKQQEWDKIKFVSIENHLKKSQMLKLVLKDQIGRQWLFKDTPNHGAISVYRAYTLLGVYTPEVFEVTLNIGGQEIRGSVQEYISDVKSFSGSYAELGEHSVNYMLDSHLLSYLTLNYHIHTGQFLASTTKGLVRIDNSVNYTLLDETWSAEVSYISPTLAHFSNSGSSGYVNFWKYIVKNGDQIKKISPTVILDNEEKKVNPNFIKTLAKAKIINLISDQVYSSFFSECVKDNFRYCSNNYEYSDKSGDPYGFVLFRAKDFDKKILARKANAYITLKKVYGNVLKAFNGTKLNDVTKSELSSTVYEINHKMENEINITVENIRKLEEIKVVNQTPVETYNLNYPLFLHAQSLSKAGFFNSNEKILHFIHLKKKEILKVEVSSINEDSKSNLLGNLDEIILRLEHSKTDQIGLWSILAHSSMLLEKDYIKKIWSVYSTLEKNFKNPTLD